MVVFFKPEGSGKSIELTLAFLKSNATSVRNKLDWRMGFNKFPCFYENLQFPTSVRKTDRFLDTRCL